MTTCSRGNWGADLNKAALIAVNSTQVAISYPVSRCRASKRRTFPSQRTLTTWTKRLIPTKAPPASKKPAAFTPSPSSLRRPCATRCPTSITRGTIGWVSTIQTMRETQAATMKRGPNPTMSTSSSPKSDGRRAIFHRFLSNLAFPMTIKIIKGSCIRITSILTRK